MSVYLGIVTVRLHDFWNLSGNSAAMNVTQFFKNLGMMGGLAKDLLWTACRFRLSSFDA